MAIGFQPGGIGQVVDVMDGVIVIVTLMFVAEGSVMITEGLL